MKRANIVGSGPNGLSAAIALARAGVRVTVFERADTPGGGVRTEEATLPGFRHDIGSAVYPMAVASPFFRSLDLEQHGLEWVQPEIPLAHPLADGSAVALMRTIEETASLLGADGHAYQKLMAPLRDGWADLVHDVLGPIVHFPRHPLALGSFGLHALQPAQTFLKEHFRTPQAQTLFAGAAAHAVVPLDFAATTGVALVLAVTAHVDGWPICRGGAQSLTTTLVKILQGLGGKLELCKAIRSLGDLPEADTTLLDVTPKQFLQIAGTAVPVERQRPYEKFQYGPGIFKLDWALSEPIPWTNELCCRAGTVHLGGSLEEIVRSEADAYYGHSNGRPFVLLSQPSIFDSTRAPAGKHTAWAYCHVPNGSREDRTTTIEDQIERFAPGFRETVLGRSARNAEAMQAWNPNLIGGDVSGGAMTLNQLIRRPKLPPYSTPVPGVFLCSSSTPPAGGVHGMCGALAAARAAVYMGIRLPPLR